MGIPLRQIIPNLFFPDSQLANKQYLLFVFVVGATHTGIHGRVLPCFSVVLWKHCSYSLKACNQTSGVVPTDLLEVSII